MYYERHTLSAHADKYIMESDNRSSRYYERLCIEARRATEELKAALGRRGSSALKARLLKCGTSTEWKNVVRCGEVACETCRAHYVTRQVSAVQAGFEGSENADMAFVTIIMGLCNWPDYIGEIFVRGRRKLRNIIDQNRRVSRRWQELQVVGWMEVDAFDPHRFADLPPNKKAQLEAIGLPFIGAGPTWVVTLHALVELGGVDRFRFAEELTRGWSGPTQVDVRPLDNERRSDQNINSLVRYCLKHRTDTATTVCYAEPWDISWRTEFYEYLNRWSRGFQSTRVWIKPRSAQGSATHGGSVKAGFVEYEPRTISEEYNPDADEDAMPFTF